MLLKEQLMNKVCAILGVGPGNGLAFARRFAHAGYKVALCARTRDQVVSMASSVGDAARGYFIDVTDDGSVLRTVEAITNEQGPIETASHRRSDHE